MTRQNLPDIRHQHSYSTKLKGYLLAIISAATYGTNPAFAVPLYNEGMNTNTVLLFRYLLALPILAIMLKMRGH
ncbi:MAG: DMT family transporter, partial [Muribaculum sp.]|nr:DMT family transporter [Muribaculum sp.]